MPITPLMVSLRVRPIPPSPKEPFQKPRTVLRLQQDMRLRQTRLAQRHVIDLDDESSLGKLPCRY